MKFKNLKERMEYFKKLCDYRLTPNSYVLAHIDGRAFSHMVKKKFKLPFDDTFINMMNETAIYICKNVQGCKIAYTQSDEISLVITDFDNPNSDSFFGYRLCKMQSIIASLATGKFNQMAIENLVKDCSTTEEIQAVISDFKPLQFDCKVWTVPTYNDAFAWLLYRQNDCIKNSKQQAAQTYIRHKELNKKVTDDQISLLKEKTGIDWESDYDNGKKYGRLIYKENIQCTSEKYGDFIRNAFVSHNATPLERESFDALNIIPIRE